MRQYVVDEARDDTGHLRDVLHKIARNGGLVINVTWQPARQVAAGHRRANLPSGYSIVSEYDYAAGPEGASDADFIGKVANLTRILTGEESDA